MKYVTLDENGLWARQYFRNLADARIQLLQQHEYEETLRARAEHMSSALDAKKIGMPSAPTDGINHSTDPVDELIDLNAENGMAWASEMLAEWDEAEIRMRQKLNGVLASSLRAVAMRYRHGLEYHDIANAMNVSVSAVKGYYRTAIMDYFDHIGPAAVFNK